MRGVRTFPEYVREGVVTEKSPDHSRARHLKQEASTSVRFLREMVSAVGVDDLSANSVIKLAYDIVMELVRAEMIAQGYDAAGRGAHEAEVAYLRIMGFPERDVQFCNQLRYFRNGIMYYGKTMDASYAQKVVDFLERFLAH